MGESINERSETKNSEQKIKERQKAVMITLWSGSVMCWIAMIAMVVIDIDK